MTGSLEQCQIRGIQSFIYPHVAIIFMGEIILKNDWRIVGIYVVLLTHRTLVMI